ncbi:hypothetical protein [Pedobacter sp. UC225_65]|uniref:hypothetical protein n=1 Tax=Pedobacter sp. UC225_65 TaxID=3350173 RepID=UPI00366CB8D2
MKENDDYAKEKLDFGKLSPILKADKTSGLPLTNHQPAEMVVVLSRHRYYRHLVVELANANRSQNGKLKNPLLFLDSLTLVWKTQKQEELKFYAGVSQFKNNYNEAKADADLDALKAVVNNPLNLDFYVHDEQVSATVNAASLKLTKVSVLKPDLELSVDERGDNFEISGLLHLAGKSYALEDIELRYHYFVKAGNQLYLIDNPYFLSVIDFFKHQQNNLVIDRTEYEDFQQNILAVLEEKIKINYSYLKRATRMQVIEQGFDLENEQLIYLSESEDFVLLTPVMRYGGLEIPVISQKQIQAKDKRGKLFTLDRDKERELQFITTIAKMHPFFEEQVIEFSDQRHADCFYMHRKRFLEPGWFLDAFEAWRSKGIAILGFNALKENKLSPYKAEIAINVISGIDWFETAIKVKFNKQTVSLKHLHKSIRNKSKFVQLDDGTSGSCPTSG